MFCRFSLLKNSVFLIGRIKLNSLVLKISVPCLCLIAGVGIGYFIALSSPESPSQNQIDLSNNKHFESTPTVLSEPVREAPVEELPSEIKPEDQQKANSLIKLGEIYELQKRLYKPLGSNAIDAYKLVFRYDPENQIAKKKLQSIHGELKIILNQGVTEKERDKITRAMRDIEYSLK